MSSPEQTIGLILGISRGILGSRRHRRLVMVSFLIAAGLLCLLGVTLFAGFLDKRLLALMLYWGLCLVCVLCAVLFAVYDMLKVGEEHRNARRALDHELSESATASGLPKDSEEKS